MKTFYIKNLDDFKGLVRLQSINRYPISGYVVFKKIYKQRQYEITFEILYNEYIVSMVRNNLEESDFKKMKYLISKTNVDKTSDLAKKAIIYQYVFKSQKEIEDLYDAIVDGLAQVQFSDFFDNA